MAKAADTGIVSGSRQVQRGYVGWFCSEIFKRLHLFFDLNH